MDHRRARRAGRTAAGARGGDGPARRHGPVRTAVRRGGVVAAPDEPGEGCRTRGLHHPRGTRRRPGRHPALRRVLARGAPLRGLLVADRGLHPGGRALQEHGNGHVDVLAAGRSPDPVLRDDRLPGAQVLRSLLEERGARAVRRGPHRPADRGRGRSGGHARRPPGVRAGPPRARGGGREAAGTRVVDRRGHRPRGRRERRHPRRDLGAEPPPAGHDVLAPLQSDARGQSRLGLELRRRGSWALPLRALPMPPGDHRLLQRPALQRAAGAEAPGVLLARRGPGVPVPGGPRIAGRTVRVQPGEPDGGAVRGTLDRRELRLLPRPLHHAGTRLEQGTGRGRAHRRGDTVQRAGTADHQGATSRGHRRGRPGRPSLPVRREHHGGHRTSAAGRGTAGRAVLRGLRPEQSTVRVHRLEPRTDERGCVPRQGPVHRLRRRQPVGQRAGVRADDRVGAPIGRRVRRHGAGAGACGQFGAGGSVVVRGTAHADRGREGVEGPRGAERGRRRDHHNRVELAAR